MISFFLFLTIVTYMWTPSTALLSKSMEQIHARFVNCVMMLHGFVKVALAERRHFHAIVQVYKILKHFVPAYLQVHSFF